MATRFHLLLTAAIVLLAPGTLRGQAPDRLPRVLQVPASTRAMALGGAYMMDSGHADALFYNPALVAGASGFGLELQSWGRQSTASSMSAAMPWLGGGIALGLQTLQYRVQTDGPIPGGQDDLFSRQGDATSERVATLGYAREVRGFQIGIASKVVEERVANGRDAHALVDVGLAHDVGPLTVGVSYRNLGQEPELVSGTSRPEILTLGAGAYGQPVGPLDLGLAGMVGRQDDGEILAGLGLELGYWPIRGRTFVGRVGVQRVPEGDGSPLTIGFAFWGDDLVLEWAFQDFGEEVGEGTHRFGVRWR